MFIAATLSDWIPENSNIVGHNDREVTGHEPGDKGLNRVLDRAAGGPLMQGRQPEIVI
jgi:hypothetical protein